MTELPEKLFSVSKAASMSCGFFVSWGESDPDIYSVCIDSRAVVEGSLFIALKGEVTDGHEYIIPAIKAGASGVMITNKYYNDHIRNSSDMSIRSCLIVVEDTLTGLQSLAAGWVAGFDKLIKIAVTGSNGKSTTKEMIGSILAEEGSTVINEGNLNSETGLPLSVLKIKGHHKYGVFEIGINHPGEMNALAAVYRPNYALITNIGTAHIGLMGSQNVIAKEKSDIFSFFDKKNKAFIYENDSWASYLEDRCPGETIYYGLNTTEGIEKVTDLGLKGWVLSYKGLEIDLKLVGQHNLNNAIASISIAAVLGVSPGRIKRGLEKITPLKGRSQIVEGRITVIEDSYNASVESMERIFSFISDLNWPGRIILVLGSMKELGASSAGMHEKVGLQAVLLNPDLIFFFGQEMEGAYNACGPDRYSGTAVFNTDYAKLKEAVIGSLEAGDLVLLKGSRSMSLDKLADSIFDLEEIVSV